MSPFNINHPLCLCCGVSLHEKIDTQGGNELHQIKYCPNCQEIYHSVKIN